MIYEFATQGESTGCHTCDMDLHLHFHADFSMWPLCPPVILVPLPPVRMVYPANVIQIDFVRKARV